VTDCADGKIVWYAANESNFKGLFRTIDREDWASDERYYTSAGRASDPAIGADIAEGLPAGFYQLTVDEALRRLREYDVPAAPVLGFEELHEFEQTVHNETFHEWEHPKAGKLRQPRTAAKFSDTKLERRWWVPDLGENTDDVLNQLGKSAEQISALRSDGTVA
jgi:crotonobetainyl-CoA:carnitine CoA-transferase CaiB-like acyl-CoA transferase